MNGIGVVRVADPTGAITTSDTCVLAATNGHTAIALPIEGVAIGAMDGAYWKREYIERAIGLAKVDKSKAVKLAWSECSRNDAKFPPLRQVIPQPFPSQITPTCVGFNPEYLASAGRIGAMFDKLTSGPTGIVLRGIGSALDPIRCDVVNGGRVLATIVIMPIRLDEGKDLPKGWHGAETEHKERDLDRARKRDADRAAAAMLRSVG